MRKKMETCVKGKEPLIIIFVTVEAHNQLKELRSMKGIHYKCLHYFGNMKSKNEGILEE